MRSPAKDFGDGDERDDDEKENYNYDEVSWSSGYATGLWITRSVVHVTPRH